MDITPATAVSVPVVAVEVLPAVRAPRRWRLGQPAATSRPEPDAAESAAPEPAGEDAVVEAEIEPAAPLAHFGRWLADLEGTPSAPPAEAVAPEAVELTELPSAEADDERLRGLAQEVKDLAEELETVRQRAAAERMRLLEDLSVAREARHAAEQELAAMQAVLEVAERQVPRPRLGYVHSAG